MLLGVFMQECILDLLGRSRGKYAAVFNTD